MNRRNLARQIGQWGGTRPIRKLASFLIAFFLYQLNIKAHEWSEIPFYIILPLDRNQIMYLKLLYSSGAQIFQAKP
jgi:hypothetical protein